MVIKSSKLFKKFLSLTLVLFLCIENFAAIVSDNLCGINIGYVFGNCNVYEDENVQYYPIYMADFLRSENNNEKLIYKIEL